jgi:DNA-binding MarR family transcriptional regulator
MTPLQSNYLEVVALAERLHRQFLDVLQLELDQNGIRDINSVQALILHNIGEAEMTASELMWRGCYLGSNVSYNLKKLRESGYLTQERSSYDKRVTMVSASPKGLELRALIIRMIDRHMLALSEDVLKGGDILACLRTLNTLQRFWSRAADPRRATIAS